MAVDALPFKWKNPIKSGFLVPEGGLEPPRKPNESGPSGGVLTQDLTHAANPRPELREIASAWDTLPEHIRLSVLALVRASKGGAA